MDYKFLSVDLSAATFEGLSLSHHRKIALLGTITIWLGVGYAFYLAALRLDALGWAEDVASVFLTAFKTVMKNKLTYTYFSRVPT